MMPHCTRECGIRGFDIWILYSGYGILGDEAILWGTISVLKDFTTINGIKLIDTYPRIPKKFFDYLGLEYLGIGSLLGSKKKRILRHGCTFLQLAFSCGRNKGPMLDGLLWHRGGSGYDSYHGSRLLIESIVFTSTIALNFSHRILGGMSTGFVRNGLERYFLEKFLGIWDFILLREPISLRYIQSLIPDSKKAILVHDFAIHVNKIETERSKMIKNMVKQLSNGRNLIGIILRDYYYQYYYPKWYRVKYFQFIKNLINTSMNHGLKVVLIPFGYLGNKENDIRFYQELKSNKVVNDDVRVLSEIVGLTPSEVVDVLSTFDYVISVRTHGFILASLAGVPAIHLYYEHKGRGILEHTFGMKGLSLSSCLHEEKSIQQIIKHLENTDRREVAYRISKARKHNEKVIRKVLK